MYHHRRIDRKHLENRHFELAGFSLDLKVSKYLSKTNYAEIINNLPGEKLVIEIAGSERWLCILLRANKNKEKSFPDATDNRVLAICGFWKTNRTTKTNIGWIVGEDVRISLSRVKWGLYEMLEYATWTSEFFSGRIETKTPKSSTISDAQSAVI